MIDYVLPYGQKSISISLPDNITVDVVKPQQSKGVNEPLVEVEQALEHPVNDFKLSKFGKCKSAAIAVNDRTRPVPNNYLLPPLLNILEQFGIKPENIKLIIAPGTHEPMRISEFREVLPKSIIQKYPVLCHNAKDEENLIFLGITKNETPVWINKTFYEADLKISVGNIEPHHFMGYSGGVKTPAIGLAGMETINSNHRLMEHPDAKLGSYSDNPVRMDVEEIGKIIGIHYCLNAVLNEKREIVRVLAGHPADVMLPGIDIVRKIYEIPITEKYDILIASPGGHPRDLNIVQSEKGLSHAAMITKEGGIIILIAECSGGSGSAAYEEWMQGVHSFDQVIERFKEEELTIGPHKAYQIAQYARNVHIFLYTNLDDKILKLLLLQKIMDLQNFIDEKIRTIGSYMRIALMPYANSTIPKIKFL